MSHLATLETAGLAALPAWAEAMRAQAQAQFASHGLPHRRLEAWKYTSLKGLEAEPMPAPATTEQAPLLDQCATVALVDARHETLPDLPHGVSLEALPAALAKDQGSLRDLLATLPAEAADESLSALNTAHLDKGFLLRVAAGVDAGRLQLCWRSSASSRAAFINTRLLVLLEPNARLELIEDFAISGAYNQVLQLQLAAGSRLHHSRLQGGQANSWLLTRTELEQAADAHFEQASLDLGFGLARHDLRARLAGSGAHCRALGAYLPTGQAHVDHHLDVRHEAPGCESHQLFRGVLRDQGRAVFNGRVHVLPGADQSEAHQSNANLLRSERAEVDTKPELIIEADEVVASHGATVGQLDETAVFYLRSRGLSDDAARQLLTGAFCQAVIDEVSDRQVREALTARLAKALGAEQ